MVWARCHFVGLTSGIDWTIWSSALSGSARASVTDRTAWNRVKSTEDTVVEGPMSRV